MKKQFFTTFQKPWVWAVTLSVAIAVVVIATLGNNWQTLRTFNSLGASLGDQIGLLGGLLGSLGTNFTLLSLVILIIMAILFGVNIALGIHLVKSRSLTSLRSGGTSGIGGMIAGFLGIGCAACGSALLVSLLSVIGAGGLIAVLPLHGQELSIISIGLLMFSCYMLLRQHVKPLVCSI
ncbi:MAG: hypothetical protein ACI83D_000140 [Planctomycetota bacterium]|jgi:hypothetical protein